ncbi:MAG: selenide, water dikinase [Chloroflexi bacterium]|nr:MAG: selenide, water dikinase [Chloroflexota bacterium]
MGIEKGDDAAVYRLWDDVALIQTVDFFPPIVDDPYQFGGIAAANALSDVYAMGGRPILALNIVGFPSELSKDILVAILKGGYDKAAEAGVLIVGGHTIEDPEPKYGLSVTGLIKPGDEITNAGAMSGDALVLTKPIGTGIITTALKQGKAEPEVVNDAIEVMLGLNAGASKAMVDTGVNAATDVTGFGLMGHLQSMMAGSGTSAKIYWSQVPLISGLIDLAALGIVPEGSKRNLSSLSDFVGWDQSIPDSAQMILCDAQTSGGLLISVKKDRLDYLMDQLKSNAVAEPKVIGEVNSNSPGTIQVVQ